MESHATFFLGFQVRFQNCSSSKSDAHFIKVTLLNTRKSLLLYPHQSRGTGKLYAGELNFQLRSYMLTVLLAGFHRLLYPCHRYVSRLDHLERNCILDPDDRSERTRLPCDILRILLGVGAHQEEAHLCQDNSTHPSSPDLKVQPRNTSSRRCRDGTDSFQSTSRNSLASWVCHDSKRRDRVSDSVFISELWNVDLEEKIWLCCGSFWRGNISGHCLGCGSLHYRWTSWSRNYCQTDQTTESCSVQRLALTSSLWIKICDCPMLKPNSQTITAKLQNRRNRKMQFSHKEAEQ
jgi:hypothetical protein